MTSELLALLDRLAAVPLSRHQSEVQTCLADARDLAEHSEWGVALENLCQNFYEWSFPLTRDHLHSLVHLSESYGLPASTWNFLTPAA